MQSEAQTLNQTKAQGYLLPTPGQLQVDTEETEEIFRAICVFYIHRDHVQLAKLRIND